MTQLLDIHLSITGRVSASAIAAILSAVEAHPTGPTTAIAGSFAQDEAEQQVEQADKPAARRGRPAKPAEETKGGQPSDDGDENPSVDDVKKAAMALGTKNGRDAVVELCGKYGAAQVSGIAEKDRAAFIAAANEKLEG